MLRIVLPLAILGVLGCNAEPTDTATPTEQADRDRAVTFADALVIAQEKVPEGTPVEVEIMRVGDREVVEVELLVDGVIREVYLDPETGEVVSIQDEDGSEAEQQALVAQGKALVEAAGISLTDAAEIGREHVGGEETIEVEFLVKDGALEAHVLVRTADGYKTVLLDPADGSVRSVEDGGSPEHNEADEDDEDDEDDGE